MAWAESKRIGRVSEVTLLTPIRQGRIDGQRQTYEQRLAQELLSIQRRVDARMPTPLGEMTEIHFARFVILRPRQYLQLSGADPTAKDYRSWLLFTSNFDGDMKDYLRDFAAFLADDVNRVWENCEGWPPSGARDFEAYWDYAKRHQIPTQAFYAAYPELSVARVRQLERFKLAFDRFVARTRRPDGGTVADVAGLFDEFLAQNTVYPNNFPAIGGTYPDTTD